MRHLCWATALLVVGCSNPFNLNIPPNPSAYCPSKAVGVFVSYVNEGKNTDQIDFMVSLMGESPYTKSFTRTPGGDHETLELDIDYTKNLYNYITVTGVARLKDAYVGSDTETTQIDTDCTNVILYIGKGGNGCITNDDCNRGTTTGEICNSGGKCCYQSFDDMYNCF